MIGGLGAFALLALVVSVAAAGGTKPPVREVWIAAEPVHWHSAPNGKDPLTGKKLDHAEQHVNTIVYRAYTRNWEKRLPNRPNVSGDNDGMPGPLIRARVGETILVHFKNLDNEFDRPHSMHFHGVDYAQGSDGAFIPGFSGPGANVKPGGTFTYKLKAGPDSAGVWPYHDHSPSMMDSLHGGLYGALSILGPKERAPDREFVVVFGLQFGHATINGRAYLGNTPVFHAKVGELVQWDVLTFGDDFHTFHVHGHHWRENGAGRDTKVIGPAESFRVRWRERAPGTWLYHCHVETHMENGMIGLYRVTR